MTLDPELEVIDALGVQAVADALNLSREAVRKWRIKGTIPDHRRQDLRDLAAEVNNGGDNGQPGWPTRLPGVAGRTPAGATDLIDLDAIKGMNAAATAEAAIAERAARLAGQQAAALSMAAKVELPGSAVRGYGLRLAGLFALDFPVLTMAFVAVAEVSPIIAAGSAIGLSLFLVLGAHLLGGVLRAASSSIPIWCRHLIALIVLITFLAAIVWVTLDLRLEGLELDRLTSPTDGLVFGGSSRQAVELSPSFERTIAWAAALVTIGSLLFGIAWSDRRHGPMAASMRAETGYRRHLRRLAQRRVKLARLEQRASRAGTGALVILAIIAACPRPSHAAPCQGPTVLALVDTTTAYDDLDRRSIIPAIERMAASLAPGQRLVLRTVRDAPDTSRLLLHGCMPHDPAMSWTVAGIWTWLTSSPGALRADREAFFAAMHDALLPQLQSSGGTPRSALVGTLERLAQDIDGLTTIWLFSDLLESVVVRAEDLLRGKTHVLARLGGSAAELHGIDVHVAGFGRFHDPGRRLLTAQEQASLIDSWASFIQQRGGRLQVEQAFDAGMLD